MQIESIRTHLESYEQRLSRELYQYYSGLKEILHFQFLYRAFLVRRSVGNLCFMLQLYAGDSSDNIPQMYAETMKAYTGFRYPAESWAAGHADGFESADYLRGWILEGLLREHVCTRYGKLPCRSASGFLKELWETGLLYSAEELCREIGAVNMDPQILADELFGGLQY